MNKTEEKRMQFFVENQNLIVQAHETCEKLTEYASMLQKLRIISPAYFYILCPQYAQFL